MEGGGAGGGGGGWWIRYKIAGARRCQTANDSVGVEKETARNTKEAGENKRRREARRRAARRRRRREEARPPPPPVHKGPQEDGCGLRPESECGG